MKRFLVPSIIALIILASCTKKDEETEIVEPVFQFYAAYNTTDTSPIQMLGFCWDTDTLPTVSNFKSEDGSDGGRFTTVATNLQPQTQYHVRAYVQTSAGTYYSGASGKFTTN